MSNVCTLDIVKDNAFNSVPATIFGKNFQEFGGASSQREVISGDNILEQLDCVIKRKLESIGNVKA